MIDLTTSYLGLSLKSPVVASASPLCDSVENLQRMEECGIAAVVLPSLFEEQLELEGRALDSDLSRGAESSFESAGYLPNLVDYNLGPERYLELIHSAKQKLSIPVIASLNGTTPGGWVRYARLMEKAGADAIELNVYVIPTDPLLEGRQLEQRFCDLVRSMKQNVSIPIAVKLSPFFTNMANAARKLDAAQADALVLFNRFYQPDLDIETLEVVPSLTLSSSEELNLRIHWIAILFGHVRSSLAVTGGVHSASDVLKAMMAGANVAMMTSALLQNGIGHAREVLDGAARWMDEHEYASIGEMRGSMSRRSVANPEVFDRSNYMKVLSSYVLKGRGTSLATS